MEAEIILHNWNFLVLQNFSCVALAACRKLGTVLQRFPIVLPGHWIFCTTILKTLICKYAILFLHTVRCTSFSGWNKATVRI